MGTHEERIALIEERAIALSLSPHPQVFELRGLQCDVKRLRGEVREGKMVRRLNGVLCELIGTIQNWIDNAPARAA